VQDAIAAGDPQTASAMNQGARPGTAIKLHENIGNTGATYAPATGDVASSPALDPDNTLLARTIAQIVAEESQKRAAAGASTAAAAASTALANQRDFERQTGVSIGAPVLVNDPEAGPIYTAPSAAVGRPAAAKPSDKSTEEARGKPPAGYRWKDDGSLEKIPGGPAEAKPTSTDTERVAAGYATRMLASAKIMAELEAEGVGKPEAGEAILSALPGGVGKTASNAAMSPKRQKYRQAQEDWVRSKLRKESGAVIADEEMDREIRVYFPQIGDGADVVAQKAEARRVAEQAMVSASGRATQDGGPSRGTQAGDVQARKKIGNVEFVKINGVWHTP
jgi:hypothetical protein